MTSAALKCAATVSKQLCQREVKVGFFQKVMAEFSNLSNRHACEPKIVSELLFPVSVVDTLMANILNTFS